MKLTFPLALGLLFLGLKLCHIIDWPWLWVLCPFWFGLAMVAIFLLGAGIFFLGVFIFAKDRK